MSLPWTERECFGSPQGLTSPALASYAQDLSVLSRRDGRQQREAILQSLTLYQTYNQNSFRDMLSLMYTEI
jgi:hypothetical protein